jgi:hypothetical protein
MPLQTGTPTATDASWRPCTESSTSSRPNGLVLTFSPSSDEDVRRAQRETPYKYMSEFLSRASVRQCVL